VLQSEVTYRQLKTVGRDLARGKGEYTPAVRTLHAACCMRSAGV